MSRNITKGNQNQAKPDTWTDFYGESKDGHSYEEQPDGQRQELNLGGSASRHCFYDLTPSSQYQISVYTQMQEVEGPSVSITDMTLPEPTQAPTEAPTTKPTPTIPPAKE
ncbi:hypothetical protein AMECASPLE_031948, partial [Ameca splendens]